MNITDELNDIAKKINLANANNIALQNENDSLLEENSLLVTENANVLEMIESTSADRDNYKRLFHVKIDEVIDLKDDEKDLIEENNELRVKISKGAVGGPEMDYLNSFKSKLENSLEELTIFMNKLERR